MSQFASLTFTTTLGSVYTFPDMAREEVDRLVNSLPCVSNVTLVNASGACLLIPGRILASLSVDGEEKWHK